MFKACFVARVEPSEKSINIFCQFRNEELGTTSDLPNSQNLGKFCFPLGPEQVKPKEYSAPEEYSFTLTGGDGSHLHGFCRCFLPPRSKSVDPKKKSTNLRYPQVLCIISPFPWFPFYFKVLQIVEALLKRKDLLVKCDEADLPESSAAAKFLAALLIACKGKPELGRIITVALPEGRTSVSPQRRIHGLGSRHERPLQSTDAFVELQIPPDTGNGSWNAGIPLARLFWHLPSGPLMALIQALLLERRIVMVAQERDTLSAGLHAAAALLYPFRWQHIYLPFLPHSLKDYLTAPMPYLVGVPAPQLLQGLEHMGLEEVVFVDLDAGTCRLGSQDGEDMDFALLPWAHHLQAAFQIVYQMLRSPTEFESTPVIGHCMQEYFLKLLGGYREFIELDAPQSGEPSPPTPEQRAASPGVRQQVQDDGYLRAHGFRFDHLSFVANQRRSEKARNFLDLLRHSQLYEVFINERLALAAADYRTSDAFEAKVDFVLSKKGKVGRFVAQAGARGVSNISAVLQRTSTLVKTGVSQIRHAQPFVDHLDGGHKPPQPQETIVPSYSIDMDSPKGAQKERPEEDSLPPPVPCKNEDPTAFFNHDHDSDEDAPPVASPSQSLSPLRQRNSQTSIGMTKTGSLGAELTSPRATGITSGGEGFDNLLNLDGVDGVFSGQSASEHQPQRLSINLSLLDEDSGENPDSETRSFDLASWGLGLPSVSEAASSVANWASSVQAMALSIAGTDPPEAHTPAAAPSVSGGRTPTHSYDLTHANSLGTINAFGDFHSPEAMRAASSTKSARTPRYSLSSDTAADVPHPKPDVSPIRLKQSRAWVPQLSTTQRSLHSGMPASASGLAQTSFQRTGSSSLDERVSGDPFSSLDPIVRSTNAPMGHSRISKSADSAQLSDSCPTPVQHSEKAASTAESNSPAAEGRSQLMDPNTKVVKAKPESGSKDRRPNTSSSLLDS